MISMNLCASCLRQTLSHLTKQNKVLLLDNKRACLLPPICGAFELKSVWETKQKKLKLSAEGTSCGQRAQDTGSAQHV